MKTYLRRLYQILLFVPLLIYFGKRSLIAFDEGFYTLQAKWILENNDWISPMWWGEIVLDRTIGIQYCLALSQKFFGNSNISNILPVTLSGMIMLLSTYHTHKELIGRKFAVVSPLILSTTLLWVNYVHMATQDIIFASLVSVGILSSIKSAKYKINLYFLLSGLWIGLAVMMKTYLAIIPFLSILPFLLKSKIFNNKYFWIGAILGFTPFIIWSANIVNTYSNEIYLGLHNKFLFLSNNNNFTKPFYYYFWNFPLNIFPWSIFSIIGIIISKNLKDESEEYFLFKYPLITLILLSLFSTKTPYYPLQFLSIISINSYLGILHILTNKHKLIIYLKRFLFIFIPMIIFIISILLIINLKINIDFNQKIIITLGLISFSLSWFLVNYIKTIKAQTVLIILGAYTLTAFIVQSGLITDRSKELRLAGEELLRKEILHDSKIEVIKNNLGDQKSVSKIIKISLLMPKIGNGIERLEDLEKDQYAWTTISKKEITEYNKYLLVDDSEIFHPWKLIKRIN